MSKTDYYDILEIKKDATTEEIKKKRKELALKYHPDKLHKLPENERQDAENRMKKINEAYEVLVNPEKRKLYDMGGKEALDPNGFPGGGFPGGFPGGGFHGFPGFNADIFGDMFTGQKQQQQKVAHIEDFIELTLEEIFKGAEITKEINRFTLCKKCDNTGYQDKKKHICTSCKGSGTKKEMRQVGKGMFTQTIKTCDECSGTGNDTKSSQKCDTCFGKGSVKETYKLKVNVPKGIREDDVIRINNEGHEIPVELQNNKKYNRSHVLLTVKQVPHKLFKRGVVYKQHMNPANLVIEIDLPLYKALCGFTTSFKHLDGTDIYVKNSEVIKDGDIKVIKNKGLPYKNNQLKYGDLFVKFKVEYPKTLSQNTKKKLYETLTDKKYDQTKILELPKNVESVELTDEDKYEYNHYQDDDNNDDQQHDGHYQSAQCAQQ